MTSNRSVSEMVERVVREAILEEHKENGSAASLIQWIEKGNADDQWDARVARRAVRAAIAAWNTRASSQAQSDDVVERVARAVKADPTREPEMPGLAGHYPETDYHGAAQYQVKCTCGFKTEPTNYYVARAQWAAHAIAPKGSGQ